MKFTKFCILFLCGLLLVVSCSKEQKPQQTANEEPLDIIDVDIDQDYEPEVLSTKEQLANLNTKSKVDFSMPN